VAAAVAGLLGFVATSGGAVAARAVSAPTAAGYWILEANGDVLPFGTGDALPVTGAWLPRSVSCLSSTPTGDGYWLVTSDGDVQAVGDAVSYGSMAGRSLDQPIVGLAATPSGHGYWMVASDGGIFSFGDATFLGSTGSIRLNQPIVGMAPTPSGRGYWFVASDGGIFSFGDASFEGSTGSIRLTQPIVGMAPTPSGRGYWFVASDGGVFSLGDARFYGSRGGTPADAPIVGMVSSPSGRGYSLAATDGEVFNFGDAQNQGSAEGRQEGEPVIGIARPGSAGSCRSPAAETSGLQSLLDNFADDQPVPVYVSVIDLLTGAHAGIDEREQVDAASLYKLFVAYEIYRGIEADMVDPGAAAGGGAWGTVAECLDSMITISDNECGHALGDMIGWEANNDELQLEGYVGTDLTNPYQQTTAADVALLLRRLADGTLLTRDDNEAFMSLLIAQQFNDRIPAGLPDGVTVAHKTGNLDGFVHDAGIVLSSHPFIAVVMTGPWDSEDDAPSAIGSLASDLWSFLGN
jgi:beta-lactamase class A